MGLSVNLSSAFQKSMGHGQPNKRTSLSCAWLPGRWVCKECSHSGPALTLMGVHPSSPFLSSVFRDPDCILEDGEDNFYLALSEIFRISSGKHQFFILEFRSTSCKCVNCIEC